MFWLWEFCSSGSTLSVYLSAVIIITCCLINTCFSDNSSLCRTLDDEWVEAAISCLECHPSGSDVLNLSFSEDTAITQKLRMYQSIVDHYTNEHTPGMNHALQRYS